MVSSCCCHYPAPIGFAGIHTSDCYRASSIGIRERSTHPRQPNLASPLVSALGGTFCIRNLPAATGAQRSGSSSYVMLGNTLRVALIPDDGHSSRTVKGLERTHVPIDERHRIGCGCRGRNVPRWQGATHSTPKRSFRQVDCTSYQVTVSDFP